MTKTILMMTLTLSGVLFAGTEAMAAQKLTCYSNRNAPSVSGSGQWILKAEVGSVWTIKDVKLSNRSNSKLGSETPRSTYDKRSSDVRVFVLKPDVDCNYNLVVPRDWKNLSSFHADLEQTCDTMDDARDDVKAVLNCTVR